MHQGAHRALTSLARVTAGHIRGCVFQKKDHANLASKLARHLEKVADCKPHVRGPKPRRVRALQNAPAVFAQTLSADMSDLSQGALSAFSYVNWTEFYAEDDWSRPFLHEFANGEGIGPDGLLRNDDLILGLFVLGPNCTYPSHAHPAEEFYIVVSGDAAFQVGATTPFEPKAPGQLILHRSDEPHAIATGDRPLFAVFGWLGDLSEPSWYREDMTDPQREKYFPTISKS